MSSKFSRRIATLLFGCFALSFELDCVIAQTGWNDGESATSSNIVGAEGETACQGMDCQAPSGRLVFIKQRRRSSHCCTTCGCQAPVCCEAYASCGCDACANEGSVAVDGVILGDGGSAPMDGMAQGGKEIPPGESDAESIFINVTVPEEAKVIVNKKPTVSQGKTRHFVIRALEPGKKYKFEIRAELVNVWGIPMEEVKTVTLTAGTREDLTLVPVRKRKKPAEPAKSAEAGAAEKSDGAKAPEEVKPKSDEEPKADEKQNAPIT